MLTLLLTLSPRASAHPHVFMETRLEFVFENTTLRGVTIHWTFDDMFTEMILLDYDKNKNRRFEASEIREIEQYAFSNLRNYGYFTFLHVDGRARETLKVERFTCRLDEGRKLVYSFFVPIEILARPSPREIRVSSHDESFFSDIIFGKKEPVRINGGSEVVVSHTLRKHPTKRIFGGTVTPEEVVLEFRRK